MNTKKYENWCLIASLPIVIFVLLMFPILFVLFLGIPPEITGIPWFIIHVSQPGLDLYLENRWLQVLIMISLLLTIILGYLSGKLITKS